MLLFVRGLNHDLSELRFGLGRVWLYAVHSDAISLLIKGDLNVAIVIGMVTMNMLNLDNLLGKTFFKFEVLFEFRNGEWVHCYWL